LKEDTLALKAFKRIGIVVEVGGYNIRFKL